MTQFKREVGAIIGQNHQILHLVDGLESLTIFPRDIIYQIHKTTPGQIYAFSHVHPVGMTELSHEDETTLLAQSLWFYPYPCRMITITEINQPSSATYFFRETCYYLHLESKEEWIVRGKGKRKWEIIKEWEIGHELYTLHQELTGEVIGNSEWYGQVLLQRSYEKGE